MGSNPPNISGPIAPSSHIIYDGLHLGFDNGTGITTYARLLTRAARSLGYDVGVVYGAAFTPDEDPLLHEVLFFDQMRTPHQVDRKTTVRGTFNRTLNRIVDQVRHNFTVKPLPLRLGNAVRNADSIAEHDRAFIGRNLFESATTNFNRTARFTDLSFDPAPDILHCTYPLPLRARSACNVYTIHDLASLRLSFGTPASKKNTFKLFNNIARTADHIVTVSETSKRDIVDMLKVDEARVTNTYQTVGLPKKFLERSEHAVANYLDGLYGLEVHGYLLVFGALEPRETLDWLIEAFLASNVDIPLVLVTPTGWRMADGLDRLGEHKARAGSPIRRLNHVGLSALVSLIRGARAVVFPSPYEGSALPALRAMMLGVPVVTSASEALSEICGDASLLMNPYDVDDMARALKTIVNDADLRRELSCRGTAQAAKFSVARYRERIRSLYATLT